MNINENKLKKLLRDNLYTWRAFAKEIWITENYFSSILSWKKKPWQTLTRKILDVLNVELKDII